VVPQASTPDDLACVFSRELPEKSGNSGVDVHQHSVKTARPPNQRKVMLMDVTVYGPDDMATHVDVDRYKQDPEYRREIHEQLGIAEGQPDLDWDYICATEEELAARGENPLFSTADYPTEEAAAEALELFLSSLFEPRH
jgi:hypothetical protein